MKASIRGICLSAMALLALALAPAAAGAAGTFYARGGGGNGGASCALGDECTLPEAVKKANEAGDGSKVVLVPGPDFSPNKELTVEGEIDIGGEPGAPRPRVVGQDGVEVALRLTDGAEIHDADVVAGSGQVTGFSCELIRPHRKGHKPKRSKFAPCKSPKTYKHLAPGRYAFAVEAQGVGGADPTPAKRRFAIR